MDYRQYDSAIGRFYSPDVLSELAYSISPYRFAKNNPVFFKDPTGLYEVDKNGNINITNPNEIKTMLGYLNHNQGASVKDIENHITDEKNGYMKEVQLSEVTVNSRSSKSIDSFQNNVQSQMDSHNNQSVTGMSIMDHQMNSFDSGFVGADKSNFKSVSAFAGYASLQVAKTEAIITKALIGQSASVAGDYAAIFRGAKSLGTKLGYAGVIATVGEDLYSGNAGAGTAVKASIGVLCTIFPAAGLTYAIIDLGVGAATGTTLTDRIASGVDNAIKN